MKDRAVRIAALLRQTLETAETALAAGDVPTASEALARHHRLLSLAAVMTAEVFNEPDVALFSGGGSKQEEEIIPLSGFADDLADAA